MTEQNSGAESVAPSAEQQPAQQTVTQTPEQQPVVEQSGVEPSTGDSQPGEPGTVEGQPVPAEPVVDGTDEPLAVERDAADRGEAEGTLPHPYVPGFGVSGKFAEHAGAQDTDDDGESVVREGGSQ